MHLPFRQGRCSRPQTWINIVLIHLFRPQTCFPAENLKLPKGKKTMVDLAIDVDDNRNIRFVDQAMHAIACYRCDNQRNRIHRTCTISVGLKIINNFLDRKFYRFLFKENHFVCEQRTCFILVPSTCIRSHGRCLYTCCHVVYGEQAPSPVWVGKEWKFSNWFGRIRLDGKTLAKWQTCCPPTAKAAIQIPKVHVGNDDTITVHK